jgi:hypothetical protein
MRERQPKKMEEKGIFNFGPPDPSASASFFESALGKRSGRGLGAHGRFANQSWRAGRQWRRLKRVTSGEARGGEGRGYGFYG